MTTSEIVMVWVISLQTTAALARNDGGARTGTGRTVVTSSTMPTPTEMIDQFCDGLIPLTKGKKRRRLFLASCYEPNAR